MHLGGEFAESNLGTAIEPDGSVTVRTIAEQCDFNAILLVLMVFAYGYPIGQFFILKSKVHAYEVSGPADSAGAR